MPLWRVTVKAVVKYVQEDIEAESATEAKDIAASHTAEDILGDTGDEPLKIRVDDCELVEDDLADDGDDWGWDDETEEVAAPTGYQEIGTGQPVYREMTLGFGMRELVNPETPAAPARPAYNPIR
jgi:hypothetical protein